MEGGLQKDEQKSYEISHEGALVLLGHGFGPPINLKNRYH